MAQPLLRHEPFCRACHQLLHLATSLGCHLLLVAPGTLWPAELHKKEAFTSLVPALSGIAGPKSQGQKEHPCVPWTPAALQLPPTEGAVFLVRSTNGVWSPHSSGQGSMRPCGDPQALCPPLVQSPHTLLDGLWRPYRTSICSQLWGHEESASKPHAGPVHQSLTSKRDSDNPPP